MDTLFVLTMLSAMHLNDVLSNKAEDRLLDYLINTSEQNLLTIPAAHHLGEPIHVKISLGLKKIIKVDEQNEMLHSQYWLQYEWVDNRLSWNVSDYEGLDMIYISLTKMWTPDVSLYNNAHQQHHGYVSPQSAYVQLHHDGTCIWWPMYEQSVSHCPISVTWFPFDDQRCDLIFESWKYNSSQLNITAFVVSGNQHHVQESVQWEIMGIHSNDGLTQYSYSDWSRSTFSLHLRRKYIYYVIHLIVPYCLFSLIDVFTFILPPNRPERLNLEMTILLTLSVYQLTMHSQLPNKTGVTPILGAYFLFVMIMCFLSIAVTTFIVYLHCRANVIPPTPMSPKVKRLFCRLASLLLLKVPQQTPTVDEKTRQGYSENTIHVDGDLGDTLQHTEENQTLTDIRNLLQTRISNDDTKRQKSDKDTMMKKDWMLAAAVIDRVCFIMLLVVFTAGTFVFILLFSL